MAWIGSFTDRTIRTPCDSGPWSKLRFDARSGGYSPRYAITLRQRGSGSGEADGLQHAGGHAVVALAEHGGLLDVDRVAVGPLQPRVPGPGWDRPRDAVAQV